MMLVNRCLALIPVVAVLGACGSGSTEPQNSTPTTTHYAGVFSSPGATGSFTATAPTPPSGLRLATLSTGRVGSGPAGSSMSAVSATTMTVVVTLINPARTFTLTGSVTGTSFSVSDNSSPPNTCTGTIGNELNATCSILGFTNIFFLGVVVPAATQGILANYCGFETPTGGGAADAALFLGIAGASSFISRIALANGSESFYLDQTATATTISDTLLGSTTDYLSGTYTLPNPLPPAVPTTPGTASGTHASPTNAGTWSASTDGCAVTTATLVPSRRDVHDHGQHHASDPDRDGAGGLPRPHHGDRPPAGQLLADGDGLGDQRHAGRDPDGDSDLGAVHRGGQRVCGVRQQRPAADHRRLQRDQRRRAGHGGSDGRSGVHLDAGNRDSGGPIGPDHLDRRHSRRTGSFICVRRTATGFTGTQNWLTAMFPRPSPSTPAPWTASVNTTGLMAGQYTASVTVTSTTPNVAPLHLAATLNVMSSTTCTITNPLVPGQNYATLDPLTIGTFATVPITYCGELSWPRRHHWLRRRFTPGRDDVRAGRECDHRNAGRCRIVQLHAGVGEVRPRPRPAILG